MIQQFTFVILLLSAHFELQKSTVIDPYFFQNVIEEIDMKAKLGPFKKSDKPFRDD